VFQRANCTPQTGRMPSIALLLGLASALAIVTQAHAQSSQGMGGMQNMPGMSGGGAASASSVAGTGTVEAVNVPQRKIKLNHEPMPAIKWPAMSMEFPAAASVDLSKVKPGSKVKFTLSGSNGSYTVDSITPAQ
jgi:Cu(I)/Ag(I) efflux system periplasmic protein CusF